MPTVEHSTLTSTELHEPKGADTAANGQVYVANGLGSGVWQSPYAYACIKTLESDSLSVGTIGTTAKTLPFSQDGLELNLTADATNNRITVDSDGGVYYVAFDVSFSTAASGDSGLYEFKLMNNGVFSGFAGQRNKSGTSDAGSTSFVGLIEASGNAHLTVSVESDEAGNTDDIEVYTASLVVFKVGV